MALAVQRVAVMVAARVRSRSVLTSFATSFGPAVVALALVGCSGAGNQDLFDGDGDPRTDTNAVTPSPSGSATAPASPGAVLPPNNPGTTPPKPEGEDERPAAKCTPEAEPNNDLAKATPFTTGLCGKIDSNNDVDYGRLTVPVGKTTIVFKHSEKGGKASYRFFAGAVPAQQSGDEVKVIPGMTYSVQVKLASGEGNNRPTYELDVEFK